MTLTTSNRPHLAAAPWCLALSLSMILVGTSDGFVVPQQGRSVISISRLDHGLQLKLPSNDNQERTRKHIFHSDM
jgi:hypothetical protein